LANPTEVAAEVQRTCSVVLLAIIVSLSADRPQK